MNIIVLTGCIAMVALASALAGYCIGVARERVDILPVAAIALSDKETAPSLSPIQIPIEIIEPPSSIGSIAVPGFERLTIRGQTLFAENIYNPARNDCYFIVTLKLADGMEIYRSGILGPGQSVGTVELLHLLTPGIYEGAVAIYSSYAKSDLQPLNGADISFTLEVLP
jgi:hypothetical protein